MQPILRQPATWLVGAIIVVLAVVAVTSRRSDPATPSGAASAARAAQSPECAYATKLETTIAEFVGSASRAANGSVSGSEADVSRAFESFDRDATRMIAELQSFAVPPELAGLNSGFIGVFQEMKGETAALRTASLSRDQRRVVAEQGTFSQTLVTKAATVQSQNDAAAQLLAQCRA